MSSLVPRHPATPSPLAVEDAQRRRLYSALQERLERHWATVETSSVEPTSWSPGPAGVEAVDLEHPHDLEVLLEQASDWLRDGTVHTSHPRYFGLYNPTPTFAGVLADALAAGFNPQLAVESHAPAAVAIERHVLRFLADRLGLRGWTGHFTSGGAEANLTAVATALTAGLPEAGDRGLAGTSDAPVVYASTQAHHALLKIVHMTGIGRDNLRALEPDADLKLRGDAVARSIAEDRDRGLKPLLVFATVGSTASGTIDPVGEIADVCEREGVALHVDAAWAGAAALSDAVRPALGNLSRARSVTVDAHKWMSVPMGAGMFFTDDARSLNRTFAAETNYMPSAELEDPYISSAQWSRRHIGLKVFLSLAGAGRTGYGEQVEHDCALADALRERLRAAGWSILNDTPLPVVCFSRAELESVADHAALVDAVTASGRAWISLADLNGTPALRACITSYRTTVADVDELVDALTQSSA